VRQFNTASGEQHPSLRFDDGLHHTFPASFMTAMAIASL